MRVPRGRYMSPHSVRKSFQCDDAAHMSGWSPLGCISQRPPGLMVRHTFSIDLSEEISGQWAGRESGLAKGAMSHAGRTASSQSQGCCTESSFSSHSSSFFSLQRYFFLDKGILKYGKSIADVSRSWTSGGVRGSPLSQTPGRMCWSVCVALPTLILTKQIKPWLKGTC